MEIIDLLTGTGELVQYRLPQGILISGNPFHTLTHHYISPCGQFSTGYWESTPGKWVVEYDEDEYCEMIDGVCRVVSESGTEKILRAGDRFVIPGGFAGTWEVVQTCKKIFVSYTQPK